MGTEIHVQKSLIERYCAAISACKTDDEFQAWFNKADGAYHAKVNGFWDFAIHIATPPVRYNLGDPQNKTALEIGCGGGRLLVAASHYFKRVIGLDIHDSMDRVRRHIDSLGVANADLVKGDGLTIPVKTGSVDFIYSFIVLQHLPSVKAFNSYLKESHRCLSKGGLAMLYYGKKDQTAEINGAANSTTLVLSRNDAVSSAKNSGFEIVEEGESWRFGERILRRGQQGFMLLRR